MEEIEAAATLYAGSQLEELGLLRVCDRLVELHHHRGLPVGATSAVAARLDAYWLGHAERLPEDEGRALYARTVGPGFEHLLGRLAAALTAHDGTSAGGDVAWAASELRSAIDAHVDEPARAAAALLHAQLSDAEAILADPELLVAYGARDMWQLVDHLSRLELGGTRDIVRRQGLAAAGTLIIAWLAASPQDAEILDDVIDAAESWITAAAMPSA